MSIPIVIQARSSSSRLPNKVMRQFMGNMSIIEFQYRRLSAISEKVIIATSDHHSDDKLAELCANLNFKCTRGSLNNVMERLYRGYCEIKNENDQYFIRVGGDDPFISPEGIQLLESEEKDSSEAMVYTSYDGGMSYGCASELFNGNIFKQVIDYVQVSKIDQELKKMYYEHTKPAFAEADILSKLKIKKRKAIVPKPLVSTDMILSIDYSEDFLICSHLANSIVSERNLHFSHEELINKYMDNIELYKINKKLHNGFGE